MPRPLRVLDFDSECRPIAYLGQDFTTGDTTAIAAGFIGKDKIYCWLLGKHTTKEMLVGFRKLYDQADIVTGHNIRSHDLPILNGAMVEAGLPPLGPKLTSDTLRDITRIRYLSKSQENLSQMFGLDEGKSHMSNTSWREANRLTPSGIAKTRERVISDVKQHMAMRAKLVRRGLLRAPKMWRPS